MAMIASDENHKAHLTQNPLLSRHGGVLLDFDEDLAYTALWREQLARVGEGVH
jgi:hypothetical protein